MHPQAQTPDHAIDGGFAEDMEALEQLRLGRRRALGLMFTAGGAALVAGCGGGSAEGTTTTTPVTVTPTPSPTPTPTPTPTSTCTAYASETNGPYPADGTNTSSGATSNVLTVSGVTRSDIRSSFIGSTTTAPGVPVAFTITLVDANNSCVPLAGYAIYVWHCDRAGNYSLYNLPAESYLRGLQVTDTNGKVSFTTIFPGCYAGRYPHIHFEVFTNTASATGGRYARLISQFALPSDACTAVYASATGYTASQTSFRSTSIASDNVFGDNSSAQIAVMTMAMSGDITNGYAATATVGLAT